MPHLMPNWRALCASGLIATLLHSTANAAPPTAPLLRCFATYAGSTQVVERGVTADPYSVAAVDVGGRFTFKAVMVGTPDKVDYIKLYAYLQRRDKDIPIHQATYLPPFKAALTPFTPLNHLYAGEVERELQYHCTLQGVMP